MYIICNDVQYPCDCRPGATMIYSGLPDDFPVPVLTDITLCDNDGFIMRVDNPRDYARQIFGSGTLTLTNEPEPSPTPQPPEPEQTTDAEMAAAIMEGVNGI